MITNVLHFFGWVIFSIVSKLVFAFLMIVIAFIAIIGSDFESNDVFKLKLQDECKVEKQLGEYKYEIICTPS